MAFFIKNILKKIFGVDSLETQIKELRVGYYNLQTHPISKEKSKLSRYEERIFSQNGEDGIITEIFNKIGTTNKFFVEIGCGDGLENNTAYLLLKGWKGLWIDADSFCINKIKDNLSHLIDNNILIVESFFVNRENIELSFKKNNVPKEFDLLSVDIDGNDYHIWDSIVEYNPRVVVIEYNSLLGKEIEWVMPYNKNYTWDGSNYSGASLKSLELLGKKKGYSLVYCEISGNNAFFVKDEYKNKFSPLSTVESIYEPPRYFLSEYSNYKKNYKTLEK